MPYNIADPSREIDDLVVRQVQVFREKQDIDLRIGHRVQAIDRSAKAVSVVNVRGEAFTLGYDTLLIATGASPIILDRPGMDLPGVMVLKSLEHGRRIKEWLTTAKVKQAVLVGMGYIGLEMAEALRARGIELHMLKNNPNLLPWLHQDLSELVQKELDANEVRLHPGCDVKRVEKTDDGLEVICESFNIKAQLLLLAIGVKPNSELAAGAGLELGPRKEIAVDKRARTLDENIYSAGDCADAYHVVTGQKVWIPLALRANRAGYAVADNVTGRPVELPGVAGTAVFKCFDLEIARTGLTRHEAAQAGFDPVEIYITSRTRAHRHPGASEMRVAMVGDKKSGKLLGTQIVSREGAAHRINAPAVALHAGLTVEEFSRTDLAYAPPFSPVWDPMLTAANQLLKEMQS